MESKQTARESFLISIINKITQEYKILWESIYRSKPFKIVKINKLSDIPGETEFILQVSQKSCFIKLTAAQIISNKYDLRSFEMFHAELIRKAAQGKIIDYLKEIDNSPQYRISAKTYEQATEQYLFTIRDKQGLHFIRTANELSKDKSLLCALDLMDIYDIAYTQGMETVLKEKLELLMAKPAKIYHEHV